MAITTDTKFLFASLIRQFGCDLVLDIGSRDGKQAVLFQDILPQARVVAFEANPLNYQRMARDPLLRGRITMLPWAVSDADGHATFHVADADYQATETEENNLGISSLLVHPGVKSSQNVEVRTVRLDTILREPEYRSRQSIGLWIDAESAEYFILDGMRAVASRVKVMHVETANTPMRIGQRTYDEVIKLLAFLGFAEIGTSIGKRDTWGDVVFVQKELLPQIRSAQLKALITKRIRINECAVFLKNRCPWLYRASRRLFVKAI
jgi:FkbM family methyltransferase